MCNEIYIIVFMCSPDIAHYCHIVCKTSPSILPYPYQCHKEDLLVLILAYLVTGICYYIITILSYTSSYLGYREHLTLETGTTNVFTVWGPQPGHDCSQLCSCPPIRSQYPATCYLVPGFSFIE